MSHHELSRFLSAPHLLHPSSIHLLFDEQEGVDETDQLSNNLIETSSPFGSFAPNTTTISTSNRTQHFHSNLLSKFTLMNNNTPTGPMNQLSLLNNSSSTDSFLWQDYIRGLPIKFSNDKTLHQQFNRLQSLIQNWCSDESLRFLGSFISLVYYQVGPIATLAESRAVCQHLENTLGPIDISKWNEIFDLVHHLYQTRQTTIIGLPGNTAQGGPNADINSNQTILQQQLHAQQTQNEQIISNLSHNDLLLGSIAQLESDFITLGNTNASLAMAQYSTTNPNSHDLSTIPTTITPLLTSTTQNPFSSQQNAITSENPSLFYVPRYDTFTFTMNQNEVNGITGNGAVDSSTTSTGSTSSTTPIGSYLWVLDQITAATGSIDSNMLAENTLTLITSNRSDESLQGDLLDLLGFEAFELISTLLTNRPIILREAKNPSKPASTNKPTTFSSSSSSSSLSVLSRVQLERQELLHRFHKMSSRAKQQHQAQLNGEQLINSKQSTKVNKDKQHDKVLALLGKYRQQGVNLEQLHHVNQAQIVSQALAKIPHTRISDKTLNYEEVIVPPQPPEQLPQENLIFIPDGFHPLVVPAFGPITHLNTLQTKVYPSAYGSAANMLVCAPTGAGKTNVALMTILQQVTHHIIDYDPKTKRGIIDKSQFKIIYVAPMKALAAEVADKFARSLAPLGLAVRELTGDMQLTKKEILETQVIVTTPEKWDVITRKSNDGSLLSLVKLLIIDEIHLLHEDRGPVLETIVARTHRNIETSQLLCRIIGLSATLPNYRDVAQFLAVADQHLYHFDSRYRPVPLEQHFIGVRSNNPQERIAFINDVCYKRTLDSLRALNQVMVFVHARRDTVKTAQYLLSTARKTKSDLAFFDVSEVPGQAQAYTEFNKICNSNEVRELARAGVGVHHAGLNRAERSWMEKAFMKGYLSVLVCTATLSWGVNLPAHTVILKGTELYDPKRGGFVDVSMLDVNQIFGRAGRPQFDTSGEAILITSHNKLGHYISLLTAAMPIESQMIKSLPDHLNAEIILGTVTNLREADTWLTYTYLYTRMLRNPTHYGISLQDRDNDPMLHLKRRTLITNATKELMKCKMVKFDLQSGNFYPTDIGRVASLYYIHHNSIEVYNELLKTYMTDEQIFHLIAHSKEFENLKVRDEEVQELSKLIADVCVYKPLGGLDSYVGKANILLQCYIAGYIPQSSTLQSDQYFIQQSADRVVRALFEMVLRRGKAALSAKLLDFCKMINHRQLPHQHLLRQFLQSGLVTSHNISELERARLDVEQLLDLAPHDLMQMITVSPLHAKNILRAARNVPWLHLQPTIQPLTRDVIRINIEISCQFEWNSQVHGDNQFWWIWVESPDDEHILHHEQWVCSKQMSTQQQFLSFTIPISDPLPTQYILKAVNDSWIGSSQAETLSFHDLLLPQKEPAHPELLPLQPIPTTALHNPRAIQFFQRFTHFNPVQTQAFHTLYHTDHNVLLGAPTGSGKTVICELAMLRALSTQPGRKIIYIAPMKALVRERFLDWSSSKSFAGLFGCSVLELTGDTNPEISELNNADIVITSPEKIDGLTRSWQTRDYIKNTCLVIIDEIHLLGQDRGPVLEVLVSRMRYIAALRQQQSSPANKGHSIDKKASPQQLNLRFVGLSTAMSNAHDIADWLNIPSQGLFNFHPAVRPVPLTTFIAGLPGKAYCPRNATMNKPCYAAITTHSPTKPVLIFVSSRRQTRLTALDIISLAAADGKPKQFLHMDEDEMELILQTQVSDNILKHCLSFGVGLHHAGLIPKDREIVESLFIAHKIQLLVATSVVAWGVNYPCHLVIVKDTAYYDTKTFKYVDYQITDVLQMIGRSGRPQFDTEGKAVVLCQDTKKAFYQKFLHSPFPIESSLHKFLHNHLNAEIAQGSIQTLNDAVEWLSWTFLFRRFLANPTYYGLPASASDDLSIVNEFILRLLHRTIDDLVQAACVTATISPSGIITLKPTSLGQLAALYYIDYRTAKAYWENLHQDISIEQLLMLLSQSQEFWEVPVRHNEDRLNTELMKELHYQLDPSLCGNPHAKTNILFQARLLQLPLPISDYQTDTQSVLAQSARMFSCLIDLLAQTMWYKATSNLIYLLQMTIQGHFIYPKSDFTNVFVLANSQLSSSSSSSSSNPSQSPIEMEHGEIFKITTQDWLLNNWERHGINHMVQLMDLSWEQFQMICQPTSPQQLSRNESGKQDKQYEVSPKLPPSAIRQLFNIVSALPRIAIKIDDQIPLVDPNGDDPLPTEYNIAIPPPVMIYDEDDDTTLQQPQHLLIPITISLQRLNSWFIPTPQQPVANAKQRASSEPTKLLGPSDVKTTKEGWFLMLSATDSGNTNDCSTSSIPIDTLIAHKHISIGMNRISTQLLIDVSAIQLLHPTFTGFHPQTSQNLKLTLMSDCYIGFDQQYDIKLNFYSSIDE